MLLVKIPLRFSIQHAGASRTANTSGFVILTAGDGSIGVGEFLCREYVTGERPEECVRYLHVLGPRLLRTPIECPLEFLAAMWCDAPREAGQYGAMCALELALLDLWGKQQGQPVAELLRPGVLAKADDPVCSAVYPFASGLKLEALHFFYRTIMRCEHVKVKGRGRLADDLAYVTRIQQAFPYPIQVRVDLNGSLDPDHAEAYFSGMLALPQNVRWFEQPFPKEAWELSATFQRRFKQDAVLCGDESICTDDDLTKALTLGAFHAVNIRIAKHGGITKALALYERALASGLGVQLGCLVGESSVLAYAGLHMAACSNRLRHVEGCFGAYLLGWDVIRPSLGFSRHGRVPLTRLPLSGLVPPFVPDRLRRKAFRREVLGSAP